VRESNTTNSTTNKRNEKRRVGGVQDANDGKREEEYLAR